MEEIPSLNMPLQRLKVAILPLDLPCSGPVTHSGDILTTDKSHGKKPDKFYLNDDTDVKKVSRFKYVTWNIRGLGEKEEELDRILSESNIKISVITESKKKLQGTKKTEHYTVIYIGVNIHIRGQSGVMIWIHKSISNKLNHYKFWKDRVKTQRGHLTILGEYGVAEGRDELNKEFYEKLQKILDKVNKKDYIKLIGDMNAIVGNNRVW